MKSVFALIIVAILFTCANAQEKSRYININGTAEVNAQADQINFNIEIRYVKDSIEEAKKLTDASIQNLYKILEDFGISKDDISVSPVLLGKNYEYNEKGRVQNGFFASSNVTFILKDMGKYFGLTDRLSKEEGLENVNSSYSLSDYEKYNKEAYQKALKAAADKAKYMTETLGINIGSVLEIDEVNQYNPVPYNVMSMEKAQDGGQMISGKVTVTRTIRVKYELVD